MEIARAIARDLARKDFEQHYVSSLEGSVERQLFTGLENIAIAKTCPGRFPRALSGTITKPVRKIFLHLKLQELGRFAN